MAEPLAVLGAGRTLGDDGAWYPTLHVDVTGRPDVADLARVHAVEGTGDVTTSLASAGGRVLLSVRLSAPVRASFALALGVDHLPALVDAAATGHLLLATTPPDDPDRPPWLALDIDGAALRTALAAL